MLKITYMARGVGGRGPANIMRHLRGISFPVRKSEILEHAREKEYEDGYKNTQQICTLFECLPERYYASVSDVLKSALSSDAKQADVPYNTRKERKQHE